MNHLQKMVYEKEGLKLGTCVIHSSDKKRNLRPRYVAPGGLPVYWPLSPTGDTVYPPFRNSRNSNEHHFEPSLVTPEFRTN
jgi:hypothetical protein